MYNENDKVQIYANYKRKNKWLGLIDYKSLIVIFIYIFLIFSILRLLPLKVEYLIYIFIFLVVPVIAILLINIGNDSAIDMLIIILKFSLNNTVYIKKEYEINLKNEKYIKN